MIELHKIINEKLSSILPTIHDSVLDVAKTQIPCISYLEIMNATEAEGDTISYNRISFQVSVWDYAYNFAEVQRNAILVDSAMRELGFFRTSTAELTNGKILQKVLTYEGTAVENY